MCHPEVKLSSSSNRVVPNELSPCHRLTNHWAWVVAVDFWWKVKSVSGAGAEYLAISIWILIELFGSGRMDYLVRRPPLMSPIRQWWSPFVLKWPAPAVTRPTIAWRRGTRTIRYPGNNSQAQRMDHRVPLSCFTPSAKRQLVVRSDGQRSIDRHAFTVEFMARGCEEGWSCYLWTQRRAPTTAAAFTLLLVRVLSLSRAIILCWLGSGLYVHGGRKGWGWERVCSRDEQLWPLRICFTTSARGPLMCLRTDRGFVYWF